MDHQRHEPVDVCQAEDEKRHVSCRHTDDVSVVCARRVYYLRREGIAGLAPEGSGERADNGGGLHVELDREADDRSAVLRVAMACTLGGLGGSPPD